MRHALTLFACLCAASTALADGQFAKTPPATPPTANASPADTSLAGRTKLLDAIQVDSLMLTPIVSTQPDAKVDVIVLDDAMQKKLVKISERNGGDVNNLTLTNDATQPLFLLAGEVVIGGKQDRIIGRNTIIPAKTTQAVPVFCVEHGRWHGEGGGDVKEFSTAKALAHGELRAKASFESQQAVWNEVAAKNDKRKIANDTGTYRQVAQSESTSSVDKLEKRIDAALAQLPAAQRDHIVGFAASINGKVQSVDVFTSHALFAKLESKLVRSYLTDSVDVAADKTAKAPTEKDVDEFVADAAKGEAERSYETKASKTYVSKGGTKAQKATVTWDADDGKPRAAGAAAPAASPTVYENYTAK
jgi:hypothetical protein